MLIINQGTNSWYPGYDGPIKQVDEIDVTIPPLAAGTPTDVDVPIGAQHVPIGGVVQADFAIIGDAPDTIILRRTNDTAGHLTLKLFSFGGVIAPVATRLHYELTSHSIPTNPQTPVG